MKNKCLYFLKSHKSIYRILSNAFHLISILYMFFTMLNLKKSRRIIKEHFINIYICKNKYEFLYGNSSRWDILLYF